MGYFCGRKLIRLHPVLTAVASFCAAAVWPVLLVALTIHEGSQYQPHSGGDVAIDGPAMLLISVLFVGVPISFFASLILVIVGVVIARREKP
jgi:hypothetical protein